MRITIAPSVAERFPGIGVAWAVVEGLHIATADPEATAALTTEASEQVRATRTLEGVKDDAIFRAYREFYWKLGIDPTKTRPSGEALNRRILRGNALPTINAFVDAYNAASLATGVSIGAYDAGRLQGDLVLRFAAKGEPFHGIAQPGPKALDGGETILADEARIINFYPYRDADATKITPETTRAVIVACGVPGLDADVAVAAARTGAANVIRVCGGRTVDEGRAVPAAP